ncbi:hypothetical protein L873DRAFT_1803709 [Choiromyces venosus 120613-1]|uniref:Uncharacterized protein n=1 Tax=Choiromyces venosus 120613-1 TaxID=1336337 RepID=A0A3N4JSE1_9PEZI|nr:hypothetical protein L873DRAFT_1803709 [Choiromyces venosus 120613-1]
MDRSGDDSEDNDGDRSKDDKDKLTTGEDDGIDSDHALGREENNLSGFNFLSCSTTKVELNVNCGIKVVDGSSSGMEHGNRPRK